GPNASADLLHRFRTEAETVARMAHPNLVAVYQVGDYYDMPYLVMEYVDGGSLESVLDGQPQPPRQAAAFVETLARALHAVHQRGVARRDLKPANVLLAGTAKPQAAEADAAGGLAGCVPKITDFGLAKRLDNPGPTIVGEVLGTPGYLAPEQAAG